MKLVNMLKFDEDTYLHILHYGFGKYIYLLGLMFYIKILKIWRVF
jgi:hypothetical protein